MPSCQTTETFPVGGASTEVLKLKGSESQRDVSTLPQLITLTLAGLTDLCQESGRSLIAFEDKIYDLSKWKGFHPGGTLAIDHMVGKDATEAIRAFHPSIVWTSMIERYRVGNLVLSADEVLANAKFYDLRHGFNELKLRLEKEGLFKPDTFFYQCLLLRYLVMFSVALALTLLLPSPWNAILGGTAVAALWQQLAFFAHDAGHSGVTYNRKFDMLLGSLAGSAFGGLSLAWWKSTHNVHHLCTNHPEHDPDIQHMPFLAISKRNCDSLYSTYHKRILAFDAVAKAALLFQTYTYFPLMALGRLNLYAQSYIFLLSNMSTMGPQGWVELVGLMTFWCWFTALCRTLQTPSDMFMFILTSHVFSAVLHVQINASHWGMDCSELDCTEHFAAKALRTTMDIDCPAWLDWFHGGLQFQAMHHLFPRMPRRHLRAAVPLVESFAKKHGLTYHHHGFIRGNGLMLDNLRGVSNHCWFLISTMGPEAPIKS